MKCLALEIDSYLQQSASTLFQKRRGSACPVAGAGGKALDRTTTMVKRI